MEIGAGPVEQADDGRVDVPHLVSSSRGKAHLWLRRVHAEAGAGAAPALLPHQAVLGRGRGPDLAEPLGEDREPARRGVSIFGRVTRSLIAPTSEGVSRDGGQEE